MSNNLKCPICGKLIHNLEISENRSMYQRFKGFCCKTMDITMMSNGELIVK